MTTPSASQKQSSTSGGLKAFFKANPWKGRLIIALLSLVILLGIVRVVLAPSIIYGATSWLRDQGIESTIEDIDINLFNGNISLINAEGHRDGASLFNIGLVEIHWHWSPLSEKSVVITKVALDSLNVNIEQYGDKMVVSGLHIPATNPDDQNPEETAETDEKVEPWSASLGEVVFTNLNVCYMQNPKPHSEASEDSRFIDYCVDLKEMTWGGTISYGTDPALLEADDLAISSTGTFKLNGLTVTDNILNKYVLESASNTLSNVAISGLNNIHIDEMIMSGLSALQRDEENHKDTVRFQDLSVKDIQFNNMNALTINSLDLDGTGLYIVKTNKTGWEYAKWIPEAPTVQDAADEDATGETAAETKPSKEETEQQNAQASPFEFSIDNINVSNSDFCYLENASQLYYCFKQESLEWKGSIKTVTGEGEPKLSIKGDLVANNTNINNPKLKRNLLGIKSVSLNKLNVASVDNVSFEDFTIASLSALQRGAISKDNTAAFSKLAINKLTYTGDAVTINKVQLNKLASKVSKNKDGSWEFDKWLASKENKATPEKDKAEKKDDKKDDTKKTAKKDDPLKVTINSVVIETDQELLFVDNSTEPAMTIGLNKLDFSVSKLDAKKPNAKSPIKLSAKTIRHATVNLDGTVSPFADKVSFDTKGKLKGFDLRAATPAAEKAIGHIIKSGQLDADLTLVADKGILDSNVGLSLYHFQMESKSKEDTAALDEKFGMPLNQTLVLLRDKDDSIHMDIPITGDVNNPSFNPMDAIIKATTKAATVTLITFYTPYGLVYAGGNVLFDLATAMNFDPIAFQPGKAELSADNKEELNSLTKLLTEKPQVHLTLCGMTNASDIHALYPDLKPKPEDKNKEIKPNKEQTEAIKKLAHDRQENSKKYLVEQAKIEHDRLILCAPEHSAEENAIAGVEINI